MPQAAAWIGRFHAEVPVPAWNGLTTYDSGYYAGWAERTLEFAAGSSRRAPWLAQLCAGFVELAPELAAEPAVVVHGEYTLKNVLVHEGTIRPSDWESAAIGIGELDIAALTDHWPGISPDCEHAYREARWPGGEGDGGFERRLALARLYTQLRWLGDRPEWTRAAGWRWRFDDARKLGEQLGLLS